MGVNYFIFNNKASLDLGVYIGGQGTYNAPQRDYVKVEIPGRNGDLIYDKKRFRNIPVSYPIVVMEDFKDKTDAIREWLIEPTVYTRLEDSYHPNEYRLAMCHGGLDFETSAFNKTGKTVATFDCRPERFLKSGDIFQRMGDLQPQSETYCFDIIRNPTIFESKPIIRVWLKDTQENYITGTKTVSVNGLGFSILDTSLSQTLDYVDIDCELMDCYSGTTNCNSIIQLDGYMTIPKNGAEVYYTKNLLDKVDIKGRWWTI